MSTQEHYQSLNIERSVIALVMLVQFVNIVDFMMVMPLGPDFASELGIKVSHVGVVAGSYTLAAAFSGIICSFFIDRFDRKKALFYSLLGLSLGTAAGAFAENFHSLLLARVLAGMFGGPATAVAMSMISDVVPAHRRGRAISAVMISFSMATTLGVPFGLEIAKRLTWHWPFLILGFLGAIVAGVVLILLPTMKAHVKPKYPNPREIFLNQIKLFSNSRYLSSFAFVFTVMMSGFLIFPNIAAFVQFNLGFPRDEMGLLYLIGGLSSLFVMLFVGKIVDRIGSIKIYFIGTAGFLFALVFGFLDHGWLNAYGIFIIIMIFGTMRNVSSNTLTSKIPESHERAGYMSMQQAVQHTASSSGGILSSRLLTTDAQGALVGMPYLVGTSALIMLLSLAIIFLVQRSVTQKAN